MQLNRGSEISLLLSVDCVARFDKSFPKTEHLGPPWPCKYDDEFGNIWEVSDLKINVILKDGSRCVLMATAFEVFQAAKQIMGELT